MKKSLIALAVLAASGAAMAQSSVTLYGVADLWIGKVNKNDVEMGNDGLAGSRLGFRGVEDLGGGLKATFNFEQALDLTNGANNGTTFSRQANVGLMGGFGTVKLGRSFTALDDVFGAANSGFDSALSANAVWQNGYPDSADAQLYYATPSFGGFAAAVSTQLDGNTAGGATGGRISTFNVTYGNGPIAAAVGYGDDAVGTKGLMLNGSYDLGMAKLMASYYTTKPEGLKRTNSYQIGADVPLGGALTLSVGYASSKNENTGFRDSGFGVAAGYSLSKRTTVYGGFRAASIDSGADKDLIAVGVNHKF